MFHGRAHQIRPLIAALTVAALAVLTAASSVLASSGGAPFPK
jgi:hypothetical protein